MSLNDFFDPVSLDGSIDGIVFSKNLFCQHITIHTPDIPICNLQNYKVALLGVPEERGSTKGIALAPDIIRDKLYQLIYFEKNIPIIDLGNLKQGKSINDTYFGLRDVLLELLSHNILPVIIGGGQDLTYGIFLAFEYIKKPYTLSTIDYRIDIAFESYENISFKNYLNRIILENKNLFEYLNIGQQACFNSAENTDLFENLFHETLRLGNLRNNLILVEPYLRDSDIVSIDFSSIRHGDAPGQAISSPNGFNAEDICQIARYAGFGEGLKVFGLFDICPGFDQNNVTASLAAQVIWYMLDGFSIRLNEKPIEHPDEFKKFIVSLNEDNNIVFYKSNLTNRWWSEINFDNDKTRIISCTENDYINSTKHEIPDRWLKIVKKLNIF
jgi:arginase family enzyme